jgi:uncharacterized integral membrane protein
VLRRVLSLLIAFPVAAILVTLAVANRHAVRLVLDPFRPDSPMLSVDMPFYGWLFGSLITGVILGGVAMWMTQGKWRRTARSGALDAMRWRAEADRLSRERDRNVAQAKALAHANQ